MYKYLQVLIVLATRFHAAEVLAQEPREQGQPHMFQMTRQTLEDKILGGWVGKAYGVAFGGATEFKSKGKIIEGPLKMDPKGLARLAGQDDMYVNMALLKAVAADGVGRGYFRLPTNPLFEFMIKPKLTTPLDGS